MPRFHTITFYRFTLALLAFSCLSAVHSQHYRGLCVISDDLVWMSGSKGVVVRTNNGGASWDTLSPQGYEKKDFRDIHAWDEQRAIVMSSGDSGVVLETTNGGKTWKVILSDNSPGIFWDAFDVRKNSLILVGDGHQYGRPGLDLYGGESADLWLVKHRRHFRRISKKIYGGNQSILGSSPYSTSFQFVSFYAASGTNVQWLSKGRFAMIPTVGDSAITYFATIKVVGIGTKILTAGQYRCAVNSMVKLPLRAQKAGGAYSFCMRNQAEGVCVGGSYLLPNHRDSVACYTYDWGKTWKLCETMPGGYRSCVAFYQGSEKGVCTGTNGSDVTTDGGKNWTKISGEGFNVCAFSQRYLWQAGNKGQWRRMEIGPALF